MGTTTLNQTPVSGRAPFAGGATGEPDEPTHLVAVMGMSGSGKTCVGRLLAQLLDAKFAVGDRPSSVVVEIETSAGLRTGGKAPQDDQLRELAYRLDAARETHRSLVVSCCALRRAERDLLRTAAPALIFVYLHGSPALLQARLAERRDPAPQSARLKRQLQAFEPPEPDERVIVLDASKAAEHLAASAAAWLTGPTTSARPLR